MVKMITGDHLLIARETSRALALGDRVQSSELLPLLDPITKQKPDKLSETYGEMILATDGFAQVFPEHKYGNIYLSINLIIYLLYFYHYLLYQSRYLIVECLRELGYKTGITI
jgi:H+-transporting ATPase